MAGYTEKEYIYLSNAPSMLLHSSDSERWIQDFFNFIGDDRNVQKYLHNTTSEALAEKILGEGLYFENYLNYTADQVSGHDLVEVKYFRMIRRQYGDFSIIIHIGFELIDYLTRKLKGSKFHFSEVLTIKPPHANEEGQTVYTLPPCFIKGYFNHLTGMKKLNPGFNPHIFLEVFEENLRMLINPS